MIKKIIIIILLFSILLLISCRDSVSALVETIGNIEIPEEIKVAGKSETEEEKYQGLLNRLDELLENVYYVYGENEDYYIEGTGFSIKYKSKYYLITAGHIVDGEWGIHKNLGFKNIDNKWIYPKLLIYEVTETTPDYAIYYSDKIDDGLEYDLNNTEPDYRLGINKLIQENNNWGVDGECGSPIIDLDGEVVGVHVGYFQDIDIILQTIDNLE